MPIRPIPLTQRRTTTRPMKPADHPACNCRRSASNPGALGGRRTLARVGETATVVHGVAPDFFFCPPIPLGDIANDGLTALVHGEMFHRHFLPPAVPAELVDRFPWVHSFLIVALDWGIAMQRLWRTLAAFDTAQVKMFDYLLRPYPRIVQAMLLRPQIHSPPQGIGDCFSQFFAVHLHARILAQEQKKNNYGLPSDCGAVGYVSVVEAMPGGNGERSSVKCKSAQHYG